MYDDASWKVRRSGDRTAASGPPPALPRLALSVLRIAKELQDNLEQPFSFYVVTGSLISALSDMMRRGTRDRDVALLLDKANSLLTEIGGPHQMSQGWWSSPEEGTEVSASEKQASRSREAADSLMHAALLKQWEAGQADAKAVASKGDEVVNEDRTEHAIEQMRADASALKRDVQVVEVYTDQNKLTHSTRLFKDLAGNLSATAYWMGYVGSMAGQPGVAGRFYITASTDEPKQSRYEEGVPADPTENMSPEDAKKWKQQTEEHKDEFKTASAWKVSKDGAAPPFGSKDKMASDPWKLPEHSAAAEMPLKYEPDFKQQLALMMKNPPKVEETGGMVVIEIFSPFVKKYIPQVEYTNTKAAQKDLGVWMKAHRESLQNLRAALKE